MSNSLALQLDISKKELLTSLATIQQQKQHSDEKTLKELRERENALKKELIRKLIDEKRNTSFNTNSNLGPSINPCNTNHSSPTHQPHLPQPHLQQQPPSTQKQQHRYEQITQQIANQIRLHREQQLIHLNQQQQQQQQQQYILAENQASSYRSHADVQSIPSTEDLQDVVSVESEAEGIAEAESGEGNDSFQQEVTAVTGTTMGQYENPQQALFERGRRRLEQKEYEFNRIKEEQSQLELQACTFHPNVHQTAAKRISTPVVERLYVDYKSKLREWEQEKQRKEDDEFERTCTFKPQTNPTKRSSTPTRIRPSSPSSSVSKDPISKPAYSFTPVVNKIKPNTMGSVAQYLERDAFERLSTTNSKSHCPSLLDGNVCPDSNHKSAPRNPRPSSAPPSRAEPTERQRSFNTFLERQQEHIVKVQHKTQRLASEPALQKPAINENSKKIIRQKNDGDFLERLAKDSEKRTKSGSDPLHQFSFQPTILPASKVRKPRSVQEMSAGDLKRHEEAVQAMKRQLDFDAQQDVTFQPKIVSHPSTQSKLKILSDPGTYLERITKEQEAKEELCLEWTATKEKMEEKECTFHPEIRAAPSYVRRIAKSMAIARDANRRLSMEPKKPAWV